MTKTITKLAMALTLASTLTIKAQIVATFDTFTLSPNSYYQDNAGTDFSAGGATFQYGWNTSFGGYWESGSSYTNINDTVDGTYTNLYGCIPGVAFSGNNYVTSQNGAMITFTNNTTSLNGFYITNTTYAWKSIKKGDSFARRFGDTTGTGSGTSIAQGEYPDWFKLSILGFRNGTQLTDTINFYLADYKTPGTANDYVIKNWQFVNCVSLGQVDSIRFNLSSSDTSSLGYMNTPAFFSMDNFTTQSTVGVKELSNVLNISLFPNPATDVITLKYESGSANNITISISDISGKRVQSTNFVSAIGNNENELLIENLDAGVYFIEIKNESASKKIKFIKF